jgi:UDP-glucose 4-epimerase
MILGARGFIGGEVTRALAFSGATALAVSRVDAPDIVPGVTPIALRDLTEPGAVASLLSRWRPHAVVNAVGYGVDRDERDEATAGRVNAHLPALLVEAMSDAALPPWNGVRLLHLGSALEYGKLRGELVESRQGEPGDLYGRSKLAGTLALLRAAAARQLPAVTARLFTVYGPGEHRGRLLPSLLDARLSSAPLPLTAGEQTRDFTWVGDVAEGVLRLLVADVAPGEVVNVATGRLTTVREFVERAASVIGLAAGRLQFGAIPTRAEEIPASFVTVRRLEELTGWRPRTTIEEGVRQTLERSRA